MANDFAGVAETAFRAFVEKSGAFTAWWEPIVGVDRSQKPTLSEGHLFGLDYYDAKTATGGPTAIDLDSAKSTTSMASYEKKLVFKRSDWEYDAPGVVQMASELANVGWASITNTIADGFGTLGSTAAPFNGETWLTDGSAGTAYCVDSYQIDPVNAAAFTQANLQTTALSETALSSDLGLHSNFKNFSGLPLVNAGMAAPVLLVAPGLETLADNIVQREREIDYGNTSGTPVRGHTFGRRLAGYQKLQGATTPDVNDWYLVFVRDRMYLDDSGAMQSMSSGPLRLWLRTAPEAIVSQVNGANDMQVLAYAEWALIYDANILFDIIKHEVS